MIKGCVVVGGALAVAGLLAGAEARADLSFTEVVRVGKSASYRETAVRGDRRSIRTYAKGGAKGSKSSRSGESVEITRLDREVVWIVDPATRTYREVNFPTVRELVRIASGAAAPRKAQPLKELYEPGEPKISVSAPVAGPKIAGVPTRRASGTMQVLLQNVKAGRQARVSFEMETFLSTDPRVNAEAARFEQACAAQLGSTESLAQIRTSAGPWMDALVPHVRALEKQLRASGGFPVKSVLGVTWEALASDEQERAKRTPVGTFISQVTSLSVGPCEDSRFEIPAGFQAAVPAPPAAAAPAQPAGAAALKSEPVKPAPARAPRQPSSLGGPPGSRPSRVAPPVTVPDRTDGKWVKKKPKKKG